MNRCSKCGCELLRQNGQELCPACMLEDGISAASEAASPAKSPECFGEYELIGEIGRGGQGVVYRARDRKLSRVVALKMFARNLWASDSHLKRFRTEAAAAAHLDHPRIVPVYEVGTMSGQHYFTMKLIEGNSLKELTANGPVASRRAAEIIISVAEAIHHAHQHGIVHRDIKPGNILLDASGQPHVTDFGLAKLLEGDSTLTNTTDVLGTPSYMPPEQAAGNTKDLTFAADVYSLGAVLYQLLTGNPPFAGGTTLETLRQVLDKEPRRPSLWNSKIDRDLETICLKCLEKIPKRRYESAGALAEDLGRWLRHEPIRARPAGPVTRVRKWIRRNPVPATFGLTMLLLLAGTVFVLRREAHSRVPTGKRRVAVVFRPGDRPSEYLNTELSRNTIELLNKLSPLNALSRGEVLKWEHSTENAAVLRGLPKTDAVLLGRVQQTNDEFLLRLQLVDSPTGATLWSRDFRRPLADATEITPQIARNVIAALRLELNRQDLRLVERPLTTNHVASGHYLRGLHLINDLSEHALLEALKEFELASAADPKLAKAYTGAAEAHITLAYTFRNPAIHFPEARRLINKSLELDDTVIETRIDDGTLKYFYEWNWREAEQSLNAALRLDPSAVVQDSCYLHCLDVYGRADEAVKVVEKALELQPDSMTIQGELACSAYYAEQFERAEMFGRTALKNFPDEPVLHYNLARVLTQLGRHAESLELLRAGTNKVGGDWCALLSEIAYVHAVQGETNKAHAIVEQLRQRERGGEFIDPYVYAMVYAGLKEPDEMFKALDHACDLHSPWAPSIAVETKFKPFRSDPRFQRLLARMKLPNKIP